MCLTSIVPEAVIPFLVLVFNSVFFMVLRVLSRYLKKPNAEPFIGEFISTMELCTGCAELAVIFKSHGAMAWSISMVLAIWWWSCSFDKARANNLPLLDDLLVERKLEKKEFLQRHLGMILGALARKWYNMFIWSFHMTEEHVILHNAEECVSTLRVSSLKGALVEGLLTFLLRLVFMETSNWTFIKAVLANSFACITLVLTGLEYTGGFFNPILSFSFNFGCKGNTFLEYMVAYWVGAALGSILARVVYDSLVFSLKRRIKNIKAD